jgi:4-hydroxy-tetrahydrodipicolinate synthase
MWRTDADSLGGADAAIAAHLANKRAPAPWGLWLPMVTPMRADGQLDLDGAQRLAAHYVAAGIDGLILLGTTGEGGLLSANEKRALTAAVLEAAQGALPVMAGVGAVDTRTVCEQVRQLDDLDLAGYLVPPPYYLRPSDEGVAWHVEQVANATPRPLMLYNVPKRTGTSMSPSLTARLLEHPRVVAVKECDLGNLHALRHQRATVFCGEDTALLDHLLAGGGGAVPASAHLRPDLFVKLVRLVQAGRIEDARWLFAQLTPLILLMFSEPNPVPVKAALALCGLAGAQVRQPLQPASPALVDRLARVLEMLPAPACLPARHGALNAWLTQPSPGPAQAAQR